MTEHQIQVMLFKWFKLQYPKLIMFAIPNAAKRSFAQANYMKAEGLIAGVSDIFLMCPKGGWHGLFIELKSEKGKLQPNQVEFMGRATLLGYMSVVCYGFEEAKDLITEYLQ